ncbi:MAG: hypothetical protein ACLFRG_08365 [Desulfococcaceae bacterium]
MTETLSRLNQFAKTVAGKELLEVIYEAEREATRAERLEMSSRCGSAMDCGKYATCLKDLILFLRHGVRRGRVTDDVFLHFQQIQDACRRSPFQEKSLETRISA